MAEGVVPVGEGHRDVGRRVQAGAGLGHLSAMAELTDGRELGTPQCGALISFKWKSRDQDPEEEGDSGLPTVTGPAG